MTKFTPGPWISKPYGDSTRIWAGKIGIADILFNRNINQTGPSNTEEANAYLIACAPDLLGALEEMYAEYKSNADYSDEDRKVIEQARTVITKARGE